MLQLLEKLAMWLAALLVAVPFLTLAVVLAVVGAPVLLLLSSVRGWNRRHWHGHPLHWLRARRGRGLKVEELARRLGLSEVALRAATPRYHETSIPKRSDGVRILHVPYPETKELQRRILTRLLARLRVHPQAMGFVRGRSIVDNARAHVGQAVVVRLDVVDFFPSTGAPRVEAYFRRIGWNREAAELLTRLTTHEGGLPQGAPTSPALSNLLNFGLDQALERLAARRRGTYTRYADDLTFSFPKDYPRKVRGVIQQTRRILRLHGYRLHERRKQSIRRQHQRQEVTGLVVNEKVALPRSTRRWLRAVRHRVATGQAASLSRQELEGWSALESMVRQQGSSERR